MQIHPDILNVHKILSKNISPDISSLAEKLRVALRPRL